MTLQALLETMEADGQRELEAVLAEDQRRADEILLRAREQAERDRQARLDQASEAARLEARRVASRAAATARVILRDTLEQQLREVRTDVEAELAARPGTPAGTHATLALLEEALTLLPAATSCHVDPAEVDAVREHHPQLEAIPTHLGVGVVVADDDGRAVDNTAGTRLEAAWPLLRPVLLQALQDAPVQAGP